MYSQFAGFFSRTCANTADADAGVWDFRAEGEGRVGSTPMSKMIVPRNKRQKSINVDIL